MLEQQRGTAGLDGSVGDLGDLELGIDLGGDTRQLALTLEQGDPFTQVEWWRRHAFNLAYPAEAARGV